MSTRPRRRELFALGAVLLVGLVLRGAWLGWDLPYIENPDEAQYLEIAQKMVRDGTPITRFLNIPSLLFDVTALGQLVYYWLGKLTGVFTSRDELVPPVILVMGVSKAGLTSSVVWARGVIVLFGLGSVALLFFWGKEATGRASVGLLAAALAAVSPIHVSLSRSVTPDTIAAFFVTLSALLTTRVLTRGTAKDYLWAGAAIGLAASAKYNAGFVALLLPLAHWMRAGKVTLPSKLVWQAALVSIVAFVATSPITVIAFPRFISKLGFESHHYAVSHPGMEGGAFGWYLKDMATTAAIVYLLAALEIGFGIAKRSPSTLFLAAFPVLYFAFISGFSVRNDRTYLPLTFFCFVLAASCLVRFADRFREAGRPHWQSAILPVLVTAVVAQPLATTWSRALERRASEARKTAREWIAANLPAGAKVALESYGPFIDPSRFEVRGFGQLTEHEPDWYATNGFQYLVFGKVMYGRFFADPKRYGTEIARYRAFFDELPLVKRFEAGSDEVRIYATRSR
jgi:4-amino-4-deoxy-L-arabinose transferase-like glycosyltransferase